MSGLGWDMSVDNLHKRKPGQGICNGHLSLLGDLCVSEDACMGLVTVVDL